jgi:RNA polymerase sigma factor (sigma-70 family)
MNDDSLEAVLDALCAGDSESADKVFRTYEPYLRRVIRRQLSPPLRAKFDSEDVVQSAWADLLQGFRDGSWSFSNARELKAFLVKATRHRFIDRVRRHQTALRREQPASNGQMLTSIPSAQPRPSEFAQANEMWERILATSQPNHRAVLEARRQGFSVAEIAERTGFHVDSIHRILRNLASRLAVQR